MQVENRGLEEVKEVVDGESESSEEVSGSESESVSESVSESESESASASAPISVSRSVNSLMISSNESFGVCGDMEVRKKEERKRYIESVSIPS